MGVVTGGKSLPEEMGDGGGLTSAWTMMGRIWKWERGHANTLGLTRITILCCVFKHQTDKCPCLHLPLTGSEFISQCTSRSCVVKLGSGVGGTHLHKYILSLKGNRAGWSL